MYSLLGTPTPQLPSCGTALATNTLSPGTLSEYSHSEYTHSSMRPYTGYRTTRPPTNTLSPGIHSKCEYGHTIKYKRGQYEQQVVWSV